MFSKSPGILRADKGAGVPQDITGIDPEKKDGEISGGNGLDREKKDGMNSGDNKTEDGLSASPSPINPPPLYEGEEGVEREGVVTTAEELVTRVIDVTDDPSLSPWTFRMWFLGMSIEFSFVVACRTDNVVQVSVYRSLVPFCKRSSISSRRLSTSR